MHHVLRSASYFNNPKPPSLCYNMANKTLQKAVVVVTFSLCLTLMFGMSHAQVISADAPADVNRNEALVELAPGVIEEITSGEVVILDPRKCWDAIVKATTCILDIVQSLGKGKLDFISPRCCEGFAAINSQCWNSLAPFDAFTTGLIKNICSIADAPPPPKVL